MKASNPQDFPIFGFFSRSKHAVQPTLSIPWEMIAPHEAQALQNHAGQSLQELASRGGLSDCEAIAVLEDRPWIKMEPDEAREKLTGILAEWRGNQPKLAHAASALLSPE